MCRVVIFSRSSGRRKSFTSVCVVIKRHCHCLIQHAFRYFSTGSAAHTTPGKATITVFIRMVYTPVNCIVCRGLDRSIIPVSNVRWGTAGASCFSLPRKNAVKLYSSQESRQEHSMSFPVLEMLGRRAAMIILPQPGRHDQNE